MHMLIQILSRYVKWGLQDYTETSKDVLSTSLWSEIVTEDRVIACNNGPYNLYNF